MNLKRSLPLGQLAGIKIRATPASLVTAVLFISGIAILLNKVRNWRPWTAATMGITVTLIHFLSEFWHQLGHSRAADLTGFPMEGMTFVGPLALSEYPDNEGLLPAETHIQRALGGPIFSLLLSVAAGLLVLLMRPLGGWPLALTLFTFLDNLLVFTAGAMLPLGFTDGSTILHWWDQRHGGGLRV